MSKRMIDTKMWEDDDIIENFTADDKYFWLYLLTNQHNNICGVLTLGYAKIARDMGLHKECVENLVYRFENIYHNIYVDKQTNELMILNWYKYNWTKSTKLTIAIENALTTIKSESIVSLLKQRLSTLLQNEKQEQDNNESTEEEVQSDDTVSIPYRYLTNTNTISNNNIYNIEEKESIKEKENTTTKAVAKNESINTNNSFLQSEKPNSELVQKYFLSTYSIYPRKISKERARKTFEKKLCGLSDEATLEKARLIYRTLQKQLQIWANENNGDGRQKEFMPHMSTWLNDNFEDSNKKR